MGGDPPGSRERTEALMQLIDEAAGTAGIEAACAALGVHRASYYGWGQAEVYGCRRPARHPRALIAEETKTVLDLLHEHRFADLAPAQVHASLLDEKRYPYSERTMYRVLTAHDEVRERRAQLRHPRYATPELLATRPNQLWSWDITTLKGPTT